MSEENAKVVGHQVDADGETYGVWGEVDSDEGFGLGTPDDAEIGGILEAAGLAGAVTGNEELTDLAGAGLEIEAGSLQTVSGAPAWELGGNAGTDPATDYLGTTDETAFDLRVDDRRAIRIEPSGDAEDAPNVIAGHEGNSVDADVVGATIAGGGVDESGLFNQVTARYATVSGGNGNDARGPFSTVGGGTQNEATHYGATVGGGVDNEASEDEATIGGGIMNTASVVGATVAGGRNNTASGNRATVGGGIANTANGDRATVGGGGANEATGQEATVPGGRDNVAQGSASFAAGRAAKANHDGAFVFGDSSETEITSDSPDTAFFQMPVEVPRLFAGSLDGGLTGNEELTELAGEGLDIEEGSLQIVDEGNLWQVVADLLEPAADAIAGIDVDEVHAETLSLDDWSDAGDLATDGSVLWENAEHLDEIGAIDSAATVTVEEVVTNTLSAKDSGVVAFGDTVDLDGNALEDSAGAVTITSEGGRVLELTPESGGDAGSVVSGHPANTIADTAVGAVISGGGRDDETAQANEVFDNYGTIGGGADNVVGVDDGETQTAEFATVSGGLDNEATDLDATVGGGRENSATGEKATVGGGWNNTAAGGQATVGGGVLNTADESDAVVGGGRLNEALSQGTTVGGGQSNVAGDDEDDDLTHHATVSGGMNNEASGSRAVVGGGEDNTAGGEHATVGGGEDNEASGDSGATVGGGLENVASSWLATVAGGANNTASTLGTTVSGGTQNTASNDRATVAGGLENEASGMRATVCGGHSNSASDENAAVGGGSNNTADAWYATVGGGDENTASGNHATVSGGSGNAASSIGAAVPGGLANEATGEYSLAAGRRAEANLDGAFVFGDASSDPVKSFAPGEARFQGRVRSAGVRTNGPVHYVFDEDDSGGSGNSPTVGNWRTRFLDLDEEPDQFRIERAEDQSGLSFWYRKFWVDEDGNTNARGTKDFVETVETDDGPKDVHYTSSEADQPLTETIGVVELEDGRAEIDLPEHFEWVTSEEEPLHVQTTPYTTDTSGLAVVERSTDHIVVEDIDGEGDYEFSYTVKGTRAGYEDKQVVQEPQHELV